jgi:hypothetical protein
MVDDMDQKSNIKVARRKKNYLPYLLVAIIISVSISGYLLLGYLTGNKTTVERVVAEAAPISTVMPTPEAIVDLVFKHPMGYNFSYPAQFNKLRTEDELVYVADWGNFRLLTQYIKINKGYTDWIKDIEDNVKNGVDGYRIEDFGPHIAYIQARTGVDEIDELRAFIKFKDQSKFSDGLIEIDLFFDKAQEAVGNYDLKATELMLSKMLASLTVGS